MSAAIKRLSTIIRPSSNSSSPPSPPKESGKDSIDAPAPAAPVDASTAEAAPTTEGHANGTTPDAAKDAVDSAAPEQGATAVSASTEDAKDAPKAKDAAAPAAVESKTENGGKAEKEGKAGKEGKATHRRDPRDIGRSTIRRFSTILRSQAREAHKDKEPTPSLPSQEGSAKAAEGETKAPEEPAPAAQEAPKEAVTKENGKAASASAEKDAKPAKPAPSTTKDKTETGKVSKRRSSSFFTAAREGLQRTAKDVQTRARGQPGATKAKAAAKVETVAKIVKKGAAKGKHVVVITGASKGVGLEFVKQFAGQPNTFVIALSRTADKSTALKPIVNASAKEGHNVRAIKLDVASSRSINNVVKDIVELTEGRIDLLINAAGTRGDPALKVWDLKGSELEDELRNNLIGPIAFTNALIQYLKPMPPKEEKKEEQEKKDEKSDSKEDKTEEKAEVKDDKEEKNEEKTEGKEKEKSEGKEQKAETVETAAAQPENLEATVAEPSAEAADASASKEETATPAAEAAADKPTEAAPAEAESTEPSPVEVPSVLPSQPFVIFLAPSDPIQNVQGAVPTGSAFAPSPRTLFSLSRAALQVAIAKYAVGLGGKGIGVVGLERHGLQDPHSSVTDEQSVAGVIKLLPELNIRDNGKLLKTNA